MEFKPTINEERQIGGSANFGSQPFVPTIDGLSGDYILSGVYQKMGKLLFWAFEITGTSTTAGAVFTPPISPQRLPAAATYEPLGISHQGIMADEDSLAVQRNDGAYVLQDAAYVGVRRFTGWYWIK